MAMLNCELSDRRMAFGESYLAGRQVYCTGETCKCIRNRYHSQGSKQDDTHSTKRWSSIRHSRDMLDVKYRLSKQLQRIGGALSPHGGYGFRWYLGVEKFQASRAGSRDDVRGIA